MRRAPFKFQYCCFVFHAKVHEGSLGTHHCDTFQIEPAIGIQVLVVQGGVLTNRVIIQVDKDNSSAITDDHQGVLWSYRASRWLGTCWKTNWQSTRSPSTMRQIQQQ